MSVLIGLFVGGRGLRMGGAAKGLLTLPDGETLIARLLRICAAALPGDEPVLVGEAAAYRSLGLRAIADAPSGVGPLGGLRALLANARDGGHAAVLVLACDMPYVSVELVQRLARERPDAPALAPRDNGLWQPLAARYGVATLATLDRTLAAGERSFQRFFARLAADAAELELSAADLALLGDWDRPEDIR